MANKLFPFWQELRKLLIDRNDGTFAERVEAYPPKVLMTDGDGANARLRVDVAQTGFFTGKEFRSFYEFSIANGQSVVMKFTSPINFILFTQSLTVDSGGVKYTAEIGGTEGGVFTDLPAIGKNRMSTRPTPYYEAQALFSVGGTTSGGTIVDVARMVTAGSSAQQITVGAQTSDERGLPAGTYYIRLTNLHNGTSTGVYSLFWEERP